MYTVYITSMIFHAFFWAVGEIVVRVVLTFWLFAMLANEASQLQSFNVSTFNVSPASASVVMPSNHVISSVI